MASKQGTVEYIVDKTGAAGVISGRKMCGEYGINCDGNEPAQVGPG